MKKIITMNKAILIAVMMVSIATTINAQPDTIIAKNLFAKYLKISDSSSLGNFITIGNRSG